MASQLMGLVMTLPPMGLAQPPMELAMATILAVKGTGVGEGVAHVAGDGIADDVAGDGVTAASAADDGNTDAVGMVSGNATNGNGIGDGDRADGNSNNDDHSHKFAGWPISNDSPTERPPPTPDEPNICNMLEARHAEAEEDWTAGSRSQTARTS
eukprot:6181186-Pleurochrysis_carterae.AAC.2